MERRLSRRPSHITEATARAKYLSDRYKIYGRPETNPESEPRLGPLDARYACTRFGSTHSGRG